MIVVWLFLAVPWVCLLFVIVIFPGHTHLLFLCVHVLCLVLVGLCGSLYHFKFGSRLAEDEE